MSAYRNRRTIKPAAMDPRSIVDRDLILSLLEDAHWAPTHGLTQPWRFHVFTSPEARAELGGALVGIYDQLTPEAARDVNKRTKLIAGPERAPVVIAVLARVEPNGKIPEWEEIAAVSCAVQNLMLSAHEHGLGTFWSTPPAACSPQFAQWLGLDDTHHALGLLYLGRPLAEAPSPRSSRSPLAERVRWHDPTS